MSYIQNKLDEFDKLAALYPFEDKSLAETCCENGDKLHHYKTRDFIEQSLTDYHNHIVEKIKNMKIQIANAKPGNIEDQINEINLNLKYQNGYNKSIDDIVSLLQDTNPKE